MPSAATLAGPGPDALGWPAAQPKAPSPRPATEAMLPALGREGPGRLRFSPDLRFYDLTKPVHDYTATLCQASGKLRIW